MSYEGDFLHVGSLQQKQPIAGEISKIFVGVGRGVLKVICLQQTSIHCHELHVLVKMGSSGRKVFKTP